MTEIDQNPSEPQGVEPPISVLGILKENWVLTRALIFFILMLSVPLFLAWKLDLFLIANN